MANKQQRNPQRKAYWKDGLQALQQKEAQQATRHRMWQRMFAQAKTDLQTEEAVVFLGAENMEILRQSPAHPAESTQQTRPPLPVLLGAAITLAVSATRLRSVILSRDNPHAVIPDYFLQKGLFSIFEQSFFISL